MNRGPRHTLDRAGSTTPRPSRSSPEDYERQELLGAGAFGKVYRVRRVRDGKIFACKEVNPQPQQATAIQQSIVEINALRNLKHPGIIRYVDRYYHPTSRAHCIVMELADGGDLTNVIQAATVTKNELGTYIPEDTIWSYFAQIVSALHACHHPDPSRASALQILHRDLKPQNILLDGRGRLKLADFGLSKALGPQDLATTFCGTPMYMAPEQVKNQKYDFKSDMWALGCIMYELCALKSAIQPANINMVSDAVLGLSKPPLPRCYSTTLKSIIYRLLSQRRDDRPSTEQLLTMSEIQVQLRSLEIVDMKDALDAEFKRLERKARDQRDKEAELSAQEAKIAQESNALVALQAAMAVEEKKMVARQVAMTEAEAQMVGRQQALNTQEAQLTDYDALWRSEKERLSTWEQRLSERQQALQGEINDFEKTKTEHQAWYEEKMREWEINAPRAFKQIGREEANRKKSAELSERQKDVEKRERALDARERALEARLQQARGINKMDRLDRRATTFGPLPDHAPPPSSTVTAASGDSSAPSSPRRSRRASAAPLSSSPSPRHALQDLHIANRDAAHRLGSGPRSAADGTGADPAAYVDADEPDESEELDALYRRSRPSVPDDDAEFHVGIGTPWPEASTPAKHKKGKGRPTSTLTMLQFGGPTPAAPPPQSKLPPPRTALDDSDEPMISIDKTRWTYDTTQRHVLQTPRKSGAMGAELARATQRRAAAAEAEAKAEAGTNGGTNGSCPSPPPTKAKKEWHPPDSPLKGDSSVWDTTSLPSPYLKRQSRPPSGEPDVVELPPPAVAPGPAPAPAPAPAPRSTRSPSRASLAGFSAVGGPGSSWGEAHRRR